MLCRSGPRRTSIAAFFRVKAWRALKPHWSRQSATRVSKSRRCSPYGRIAIAPPLDPKIIGPAEALVAKYFPGVPLIPSMSTGATDGIFLEAIGIPVYGAPGGWGDPDGNGAHGLNERRSVRSVYIGRDFLTDLVKAYADAT